MIASESVEQGLPGQLHLMPPTPQVAMSDENVQVFLHSQVDAENSVPGMEDELTRQVPVVSSP
jgi:hypothetical protein